MESQARVSRARDNIRDQLSLSASFIWEDFFTSATHERVSGRLTVSRRNITTMPHRILHAQSLQYLQSLYPPQLRIPHYSYILRIRNLNLQPPPQFLLNLRVRLRTPLTGYPFNVCQLTSGHGVIHGVHVYGRLAFSRVRNGLLHRKAKVRVRNCGAKPAPLTDFTSSVIFALKIRNY